MKHLLQIAAIALVLLTAAGARAVTVYAPSTLDLRPDNAVPPEWQAPTGAVRVAAAPGRIADVALALSGDNRPLTDVRLEISPLIATFGTERHQLVVPAERVRAVVCAYRPKGGLGGPADWDAPGSYDYIPYLLLYDAGLIHSDHAKRRSRVLSAGPVPDFLDDAPPLKPCTVPAAQMRQWLIMIPVPARGTPPGCYQGEARFVSGGRILASQALELTVLPFEPLPPAKLYGMYENLSLSGLTSTDPRYRLMLEDLVEAGIHNLWLTAPAKTYRTPDGERHTSFEDIERIMALRGEVGMDTEVAVLVWGGTGFNFYAGGDPATFAAAAKRLRTWWDVRGFSADLAVYGIDEASGDALREHAALYRAVAAEGVKVAAACAGGYFADAGGAIAYPIIEGGMQPDDPIVADVAAARAAGATVLNYGQPQLIYHDPLLYRVRAGFDLWHNVYDGWYPFTYAWMLDEEHRGLRAITKGGGVPFKTHGLVVVGKDRLLPQVEWPAVRQGVDDVRYATTLAAQVLTARDKGLVPALADAAEVLLRDTGVRADDWRSVENARVRVIDAILALEKAHPDLRVAVLARSDVKALAKRVNAWILPDLTFRPFPMGIAALAEKVAALETLAAERPLDALFAGLEAKDLVREARAAERLNAVEAVIAMSRFGNLIMETEEASLTLTAPKAGGASPLETHFNVMRVLNDGWLFQPDRGNDGLRDQWFDPAFTREGWTPIDVTKFWQQQGRAEWQDLEGSRVGMEGIGWYALSFDVPSAWVGKRLYLWFVCDEEAIVWVNGVETRVRNEGSTIRRWLVPALAPLTELKPGDNTVVLRVFNAALAGGLWNGVRIVERK